MAQMSRPFPGITIGDAGPYSVINWWDVWGAIGKGGVGFGRSADYGKGVFGAIGNGLYPSENITNINVNTGAGLIDGLYCENTASVTVPIPASGAGTNRIDVIVVRKNYQQAVTYTPTGGAPTVPPRTARITVIRGTEAAGPVAPSVTQDVTRTTYWDIPIAQVQVSAAGALSNFTDLREFIDAETKSISLSVVGVHNSTDNVDIVFLLDSGQQIMTWEFTDGKDVFATSNTINVPSDYISDFTVYALFRGTAGGGNMAGTVSGFGGACGNSVTNKGASLSGPFVIAAGANNINCIESNCATASFIVDDKVRAVVVRNGGEGDDTLNTGIKFIGFYASYFGWKK